MNVLQQLSLAAIVPVVVLDRAEDAVPVAEALMAGGIRGMEITFRTAAAPQAIREVVEHCPDMLVGAGTVITLEQCRNAVEMGAKFIVSPGFDQEVVSWCVNNGIPVVPGCVTPTEIMAALRLGIQVVKFFPANVYGGLSAMKSLAEPFCDVKFIPTGGVNTQNIGEYMAAPYVYAVGGSWVCPRSEIAAGNFEKITALCKEARNAALGFEVAHIGINTPDEHGAMDIAETFGSAFGFDMQVGPSSIYTTSAVEFMKSRGLGECGHIAVRTNNVALAVSYLEEKGFHTKKGTEKYQDGRVRVVYLEREIGGFAIHLLQK